MSTVKETMYKKRAGTSGMSGQLYKTKLISLVLFKLLHDERFEYFYLASNMDEIGSFDDLCFKAKIKGIDRPVFVFIQAKHKDDHNSFVDFDDAISFHDSYSKVLQKFYLNSKAESEDKIFNGKFDENECIFILYTNAKHTHESDLQFDSVYASSLNDLLATGKGGTHLFCTDKIVKIAAETILKEEISSLAEHFTRFLKANTNQSMQILLDNYMLRYHVLLATSVVNISSIESDEQKSDFKWRTLTFREDFFETNDTTLLLLKKAICKQILQHQINEQKKKKHVEDSNAEKQLSIFFDNPCASTLGTLIGTHIEYKNEVLQFILEKTKDEFKKLEQIKLSQVIIEEAEAIAARNILLSLELKVPVIFGNTDLMIYERNITVFITNIVKICKNFKLDNGHKIVTIDETVEDGLLCVDGGLAGAVGNLLVFDEETKLLQFTHDCTLQQNNTRIVLEKLKSSITDLHQYRFYVKATVPFPKLSFDCQDRAKDVLHKFIIYSEQSNQNKVEELLIKQIKDYYNNNIPENLQVRPEAIFLNYHGAVLAWWLIKNNAPYLTKQTQIYQEAMNSIIHEPLMSSLKNAFNMTKMKNIEYTTHALETLQRLTRQSHETDKVTLAEKSVIFTDVTTLTAIKVMHYLNHLHINNYTVLDLSYTFNLSTDDFCALKVELKKTNKYIIIICEKLQGVMYEKYLKEIIQAVEEKQKVVITDILLLNMVLKAFSESEKENTKKKIDCDDIIYEQQSLIDYTQDSQKNIIKNKKVVFQGQPINLDLLLDNISSSFIEGPVLNKVVFNETIELGAPINDPNYDEISYLYQDRSVEYLKPHLVPGNICVTGVDYILNDISRPNQVEKNKGFLLKIDLLEDPNNYTHHIDSSYSSKGPFYIDFVFVCRVNLNEMEGDLFNSAINLKKEDQLIYRLSLHKNHIKNKVWIVKITLFDCLNLCNKWQKDKKTDKETLKTLRNICGDVVYDSMIRYDSSKLSRTPGALNAQINNSLFDDSFSSWRTFSSSSTNANISSSQDFNIAGNSRDIEKILLQASKNKKLIHVKYSSILDSNSGQFLCPTTSVNTDVLFENANVGSSDDKQANFYKNRTLNNRDEPTSSRSSDVLHKDIIHELSIATAKNYYSIVPNITISLCNDGSDSLEANNYISIPNTIIALPWHQHQSKFDDNPVYNFRINYNYKNRKDVKTFNDIKENVVLLTGKAGVGKSTLLAHLSRKQNKLEDNIWILRMNLVNYSKKFNTWRKDKSIVIDTLETLKFLCQVITKNKNITIDLKESCNKIYLENCSGDAWDRFNLNMFLHYYNNRKLLMLFDGFDEICPDYKNEVIKLLQVVQDFPQSNKVWITSRPYNSILPDLERHFGNSVTIAHFNKTEQSQYLGTFWNEFLVKNSIYNDEKMQSFFLQVIEIIIPLLDNKLKVICYDFYNFILAKFPLLNGPYFKLIREEIEAKYRSLDTSVSSFTMSKIKIFLSTPLLTYLSATYFVNEILNLYNVKKKINLNRAREMCRYVKFSGITMYEYFIDIKLRKILFEDKCGLNVDIPFINEKCELELEECMTIHKKLGAHAIFGNPLCTKFGIYLNEFKEMSPFKLDTEAGKTEFYNLIGRIMLGKERTGLISHVTRDHVPVFIHETFTEYFAFGYIYDIIKSKNFDDRNKKLLFVIVSLIINKNKVKDDCGDPVFSLSDISYWMSLKSKQDKELNCFIEETMHEWEEITLFLLKTDPSRLVSFIIEDYFSKGAHPDKITSVGVER